MDSIRHDIYKWPFCPFPRCNVAGGA
uniref:Uncharacterized protein n=1 Tax=Anguilla anguilla TaxID=7936 RepID=A0A0E9U9N5_ANGAN